MSIEKIGDRKKGIPHEFSPSSVIPFETRYVGTGALAFLLESLKLRYAQ